MNLDVTIKFMSAFWHPENAAVGAVAETAILTLYCSPTDSPFLIKYA